MPPPCPISKCCAPTFTDPCTICSSGVNYPTTLNLSDSVLGSTTIVNSFGQWKGVMNVASVTNAMTSACTLPAATRTVAIRWTFYCFGGHVRLYITHDYCQLGTFPNYDAYAQNTNVIDAAFYGYFAGLRTDNATCAHMDMSFTRPAVDPNNYPLSGLKWKSGMFLSSGVVRIWHT